MTIQPAHTAGEVIPRQELDRRHALCRTFMEQLAPKAEGLLVFSRVNIYYLTGTLGNGVFWLPKEGEPVLLVRHGIDRCKLESSLPQIHSFKSYSDIRPKLTEAGSPLGSTVAAEQSGLTWQLSTMLTTKLPDTRFVSGDAVLVQARARKSEWELSKLRIAGKRHAQSLCTDLPAALHVGMTEREVSHTAWEVFFKHGHIGMMRMNAHNEEIFLGHVSAGESGIYPNHFNGPLGLKGEHPASPYMGNAGIVWNQNMPLAVDIGFCLEGYHTDKTQVYWAGNQNSLPDTVKKAHDLCITVQQQAAEAMVPGAIPSQIYAEALKTVEKAGMSEGFMGLGSGKVSFLGHGIGLGIDEFPVLAKRFDAPLEAGMVMAIEPKIGIPGVGMVGVENTFEITDKSTTCLTGQHFEIICIY